MPVTVALIFGATQFSHPRRRSHMKQGTKEKTQGKSHSTRNKNKEHSNRAPESQDSENEDGMDQADGKGRMEKDNSERRKVADGE
jgi:hypothetical protein